MRSNNDHFRVFVFMLCISCAWRSSSQEEEFDQLSVKIDGIPPQLLEYMWNRDGNALVAMRAKYPDLPKQRQSPETLSALRKWLVTSLSIAWKAPAITSAVMRTLTAYGGPEDVPIVRVFLLHPNTDLRADVYSFLLMQHRRKDNREARLAIIQQMFFDLPFRAGAIRNIESEKAQKEFINLVMCWCERATPEEKKGDAYALAEKMIAFYEHEKAKEAKANEKSE